MSRTAPPAADRAGDRAEDRPAPDTAEARRLRHIPALDGLRTVAVAMVIGAHTGLLPGGVVGVDLFFALSGFLITTLLLEEINDRGRLALGRFYARRALRLYPALLVVAVFVFAWESAGFAVLWPGVHPVKDTLSGVLYVTNLLVGNHYTAGMLGHTWSLAEEEQFYLLWPLVLLALLRLGGRQAALRFCAYGVVLTCVIRSAATWHGVDPNTVAFRPWFRADALLVGCGLSLAWKSGAVRHPPPRLLVAVAVGVITIFAAGAIHGSTYSGLLTLVVVAMGIVVLRVLMAPPRLLAWRPLVWLGRRSYGIYLWHIPILLALGPLVPLSLSVDALWSTPLAVGAAALSYRFVEQPVLARRRSLLGPSRLAPPIRSASPARRWRPSA